MVNGLPGVSRGRPGATIRQADPHTCADGHSYTDGYFYANCYIHPGAQPNPYAVALYTHRRAGRHKPLVLRDPTGTFYPDSHTATWRAQYSVRCATRRDVHRVAHCDGDTNYDTACLCHWRFGDAGCGG